MALSAIGMPPTESPVSLYLDLAPGAKADLEIVSRAALAYASAIREAAYVIDPSLEIRIELISGTESSLSLNSIIRAIRERDVLSRRNLFAVATVALIWFRHETLVWGFQETLNLLSGHPSAAHLSQEDLDAIAYKATEIIEKHIAAKQVEQVYRTLDADPAVQGVGATSRAGEKPDSIVPRNEFGTRSGSGVVERFDVIRRIRPTTETLTLIRPILEQGARRWGFRGKEGEFGAVVRDSQVIENIIDGHTAIPMVGGIQLVVDMQTTEEFIDGVWTVTDRTILRIHQIIPPRIQLDLPSPPPKPSPQKSPRSRRKHK